MMGGKYLRGSAHLKYCSDYVGWSAVSFSENFITAEKMLLTILESCNSDALSQLVIFHDKKILTCSDYRKIYNIYYSHA